LPLVLEQLKPDWSYLKTFHLQDHEFKHRQKSDFKTPITLISEGSDVWVMIKDRIDVPRV